MEGNTTGKSLNDITIGQVKEVIRKCEDRYEVYGVDVCRLNVLPCEKAILKGECVAVHKLLEDGDSNG